MTELTYSEFVASMQREVKEQLQPEVCVETYQAVKNNNIRRTGLVLSRQGVNISPTIYLEEFYEQYRGGAAIPALARMVLEIYEQIQVRESYPYGSLLSFAWAKERICCKLIGRERNQELLEQVPYEEYLDLAIVYYVMIEQEGLGAAMMLVRREHLEQWGVTREEIADLALANTARLLPLSIQQISESMYAVTNQECSLGASAILYPGVAAELCRRIGGNYYLIPSSVHEWLAVPESCGIDRSQLGTMLEEVNRSELEEEEVLSERIYYYDSEAGEIR